MRTARIAITVLAGLLAAGGPVSAQTITSQQADQIIKELQLLRQAVERLQAPQAPQPQAPPAPPEIVQIKNVSGYMLGRPDAPLTMVEFTDLQCPFCNRFAITTFDQLKKDYIDTGKVRSSRATIHSISIHRPCPPRARHAARATRAGSGSCAPRS